VPRNDPPKEHQFKPGQSGNPKGYSRKRRITDALLDLIAEHKADKTLANVWLTAALKGNFPFFRELLDRTEGPVKQIIETHDSDEAKPRIEVPDVDIRSKGRKRTRKAKKAGSNGDVSA
jgi:hypothetical protein